MNTTPQPLVRVLLADDSARARTDIRALLHPEPVTIVAEAANGREAVRLAQVGNVDVAVMDLAMPVLNGIEATREICLQSLRTRVLLLSGHQDEHEILGALKAGARGYVAKTDAGEELAYAISEVVSGRTYVSSTIRRIVAGRRLAD